MVLIGGISGKFLGYEHGALMSGVSVCGEEILLPLTFHNVKIQWEVSSVQSLSRVLLFATP